MTTKAATTEMRRCIGSTTFDIEPHEAPVADFPTQPSQKDGLGRMCKPHWRQYTNALRKAAVARRAAAGEAAEPPASANQADEKAEVASAIRALATGKPAATATKRERRRRPMAHLPSKGGNQPPETK